MGDPTVDLSQTHEFSSNNPMAAAQANPSGHSSQKKKNKKQQYNNLQNMVVQNLRTTKGNSLGPVGGGHAIDASTFKGASEVQGVFGMPQRECTESDLNLVYRHQQSLKNS